MKSMPFNSNVSVGAISNDEKVYMKDENNLYMTRQNRRGNAIMRTMIDIYMDICEQMMKMQMIVIRA